MESITPRNIKFEFAEGIPKHYAGNDPVLTSFCNSLHLIFPGGERFFVKSVKAYAKEIQDPELKDRVRKFIAQEAFHSREHERFFDIIRSHGLNIDLFLKFYEFLGYRIMTLFYTKKIALSITVALEHFTAILGYVVLKTDIIAPLDPRVVPILKWHAAEEIEHKAVAFDVLAQVAPSYGLRVLGMLIAIVNFSSFWAVSNLSFLIQNRVGPITFVKGIHYIFFSPKGLKLVGLGDFLAYFKPSFHPNDLGGDEEAAKYLQTIGEF